MIKEIEGSGGIVDWEWIEERDVVYDAREYRSLRIVVRKAGNIVVLIDSSGNDSTYWEKDDRIQYFVSESCEAFIAARRKIKIAQEQEWIVDRFISGNVSPWEIDQEFIDFFNDWYDRMKSNRSIGF